MNIVSSTDLSTVYYITMADTTDDLKHPPQEQVSYLIIEVTYIRDFFRNEKTTKNEACEIEASVTVKKYRISFGFKFSEVTTPLTPPPPPPHTHTMKPFFSQTNM